MTHPTDELALLNKLIELGAAAAQESAKANSDDGMAGSIAQGRFYELRYQMRALLAEQAQTEPTNLMGWIYEDSLPDAYPYHAMFPHSAVIDGVRMFPVYAPTQPLKAEQAKDAAEDAEILAAVHRELDDGDRTGNAPGHAHKLPGIWDDDNGAKSGKPCAWCLTWVKFTALIDRAARAAERKA